MPDRAIYARTVMFLDNGPIRSFSFSDVSTFTAVVDIDFWGDYLLDYTVGAEAVALNATQEQQKRELRDTSIELRKCMRELYNLASGYVESAATAVERSSPDAKIIRRLRSRIQRPDRDEAMPVEPAPMRSQ